MKFMMLMLGIMALTIFTSFTLASASTSCEQFNIKDNLVDNQNGSVKLIFTSDEIASYKLKANARFFVKQLHKQSPFNETTYQIYIQSPLGASTRLCNASSGDVVIKYEYLEGKYLGKAYAGYHTAGGIYLDTKKGNHDYVILHELGHVYHLDHGYGWMNSYYGEREFNQEQIETIRFNMKGGKEK